MSSQSNPPSDLLQETSILKQKIGKPEKDRQPSDVSSSESHQDNRYMTEAVDISEERLRSIVSTSREWIWIMDTQGRYTFSNPAVLSILGYHPAEIVTQNILQFIHQDDITQVKELLARCIKHKTGWLNLVFRWKHKNGDDRYLESNAVAIFDNKGNITGFQGSKRDITERRQTEEENTRNQLRLQQTEKMEAIGTLAGGVAHDLNNVIGILVGYADLILTHVSGDSPLRMHIEKMMQGGVRAAQIVQDLLTLAKRGVHTRNVVNVNSIISDFQKTLEFEDLRGAYPRVRLQFKLAGDLLNIKGSPTHISRAFMNLLTNAMEAMPQGGTLSIKTGNVNLDRPIRGYDDVREGDYITLAVSDTGKYIDPKDLKHIFEPFYTKKIMGRSGSGLGMAVAWSTVREHNGYIDIQSKEGKGTTIVLYLPVTKEILTALPEAKPLNDYLGNKESILVVDDIKEQRELASMILDNLNYKVNTVSSGEEAVSYLKSNHADLLVLDMIMDPGMDGLDTYKSILKTHPGQKAVIVSGFSESERVLAAQTLGAGAYLKKPYTIEKLGMTVRNELDRAL